jgi:hypothetical protein
VALLRHPHTPPDCVPALLPGLPRRDIEDLLALSRLPEYVRDHLHEELSLGKKQ